MPTSISTPRRWARPAPCARPRATGSASPWAGCTNVRWARTPMWSCQLAFPPDKAGAVLSWLALNREGLTVFTHALTGDDIKDHTDHAIWMGAMLGLDLSVLE